MMDAVRLHNAIATAVAVADHDWKLTETRVGALLTIVADARDRLGDASPGDLPGVAGDVAAILDLCASDLAELEDVLPRLRKVERETLPTLMRGAEKQLRQVEGGAR